MIRVAVKNKTTILHIIISLCYLVYFFILYTNYIHVTQRMWMWVELSISIYPISKIYLSIIALPYFQQHETILDIFNYLFFIFAGSLWWYFLSFVFLKLSQFLSRNKFFITTILYIIFISSWLYFLHSL